MHAKLFRNFFENQPVLWFKLQNKFVTPYASYFYLICIENQSYGFLSVKKLLIYMVAQM